MKKLLSYLLLAAVLLLAGFLVQPLLSKKSIASTPTKEEVRAKLQHLSIPFTQNLGQTDKKVKFYANTFGGTVFVTGKGEIVYSLPKIEGDEIVSGAVIREKPLNAKIRSITGEERSAAVVNYFKGNDRTQWKKNLPTYNFVSLGEVYQGVDLKLKAYGNNVEKLFYVRPQADATKIAMTVEGAKQLKVNKQGELEISTGSGIATFTKPIAYQNINGKRVDVAAIFNPKSAIGVRLHCRRLRQDKGTRYRSASRLDLSRRIGQRRVRHQSVFCPVFCHVHCHWQRDHLYCRVYRLFGFSNAF
jgi:hypothetical protein